MSPQLVQTVRTRAEGRCEYCHLRDAFAETPFQVDHIIAEKHGGATDPDNLAWACFYCNNYKGPNIAGIDPVRVKLLGCSIRDVTDGMRIFSCRTEPSSV